MEGSGRPPSNPQERPLKAGEIILGYPDETGELPPMPTPDVLGRNGTYVVFRKLHTKVAAYRQYLRAKAANREQEARLGAKMVGRWQSGAPLALSPEHDDPELGSDPRRNNDFLYGDDPRGFKCPAGAHARRANPRDALDGEGSVDVRLHRMIRRGTSYGPMLGDGVLEDDGVDRGIIFVFAGAHIKRQFEFVKTQWLNDGIFIGAPSDTRCGSCACRSSPPSTGSPSNFALPTHDGSLEVGGAVENPLALTLDDLRDLPAHERAVTLECAGNGRLEMRPLPTGEPWGDYAVSTARWKGALLHEVLQLARPRTDGVDVRFEGADHGAYHLTPVLADTDKNDLAFVRALSLAHAADPAAEILIAYEMNGEPLGSDHGSPFRVIVPHWYAVASVKWLKRIDVLTEPFAGEFQTGHYMYEWADRAPEPVDIMRARITAPAAGSTLSPGTCTVRGKAWSGTGPVTRVEVSLTGAGE